MNEFELARRGWRKIEPGWYRHDCGSEVRRRGRHWICTFVDGTSASPQKTLSSAIRLTRKSDPDFWSLDDVDELHSTLSPKGGVMIGVGKHRRVRAFTVRTSDQFAIQRFVIRLFHKYADDHARCSRCGEPMRTLYFEPRMYFGDQSNERHRTVTTTPIETANKPGESWKFAVCACGSPVWIFKDAPKLAARIEQAHKDWIRQERNKSAPGGYAQADIDKLFQSQEGRCAYCNVEFASRTEATIDHVVALSAGGSNWPSNLRLACRSCNSEKGTLPLDEFLQLRAKRTKASGSSRKLSLVEFLRSSPLSGIDLLIPNRR